MDDSEIKKFFEDQTIFITGGTGFLGKVLIEKLLFKCSVRKVYILVRPKRGRTLQERIHAFFDFPCFDRLKKEKPGFEDSVQFIYGDCEEVGLGLDESEGVLVEETNVVIHAAANVKFDQPLRQAANINVGSTRDMLQLAKRMPLLKAFVYVSTAYSNCPHRQIGEQFYDPPLSPKKLMDFVDNLDDQVLERITPGLVVPWPNTYTFTKSVAEDLIRVEGKDLPVAIVRPAIVVATFEEPMPGWIDNLYGAMGVTVGAGLGVLRSFNAKVGNNCTIVPCDFVANLVLSSAWSVAKERRDNVPIYNYVGYKNNVITWRKFIRYIKDCRYDYATDKILWYSTFKMRENLLWHRICVFFQHTLLAYIADFVLICLRRPPIAVKNYARMDKLLTLTAYFTVNSWTFDSDNVDDLWDKMGDSDRKGFNFDMHHLDWVSCVRTLVMGARVYLVKDPLDTVPQGRRKLRILTIVHHSLVTILYLLLFSLLWWIVRLFF